MNFVRASCALLVLVFASIVAAGNLYATTLSALFDNQTITANDKLFNGFTFISSQTTNGGSADPSQIDVTPLTNDPLDPGLKFTAPIGALGTPFGHSGPSSAQLSFSYNVSTLSGLSLIKDNSLLINGFTLDAGPGVSIQVTEQVFDSSNVLLGTRQALVLDGTQVGDASLFDSGTFAPQSFVHVVKQIVISGPGDNYGAFLRSFEQRFSQIPEPSSTVLLGIAIAVAAMVTGVRNRQPDSAHIGG